MDGGALRGLNLITNADLDWLWSQHDAGALTPGWTPRREGTLVYLTRNEDAAAWCRDAAGGLWVPIWPHIDSPPDR